MLNSLCIITILTSLKSYKDTLKKTTSVFILVTAAWEVVALNGRPGRRLKRKVACMQTTV